jgi:putative Ig domain-containing protein
MTSARFAAVACLACLGAIWVAGCGGGGNTTMISIAIATPNGSLMMDESQPAPAAPNAIILTAGVGGDTAAKGVTWMFQAKQTCAGSGLNAPNCGTLTTIDAFHVTYTAPAITVATSVIIVATSAADTKTTQTITLSIVLPPVFATTECNPSGVLPCTLPNGNNAVPYSASFTFTGGVQPYTYVLTGTLPQGLNLQAASSGTAGNIVGTPSGSGTSQFTVKVTDSGGAAAISQDFIIKIAPAPKLSLTAGSLPTGTLNSRYNDSIASQGGVAPFTWTKSAPNPLPAGDIGGLPPGLTLNGGSGQITGIPIDESPAVTYPATYVFGIQVQDSAIPPQVAPTPPALPAQFSITIQKPQALSISTTPGALTPGTTATAYTATLNASGGVPPYVWSVIQGQLPSGLILSTQANGTGTITGVPLLVTTANFTVQVADSAVNPANGNPAPATSSAQFSIAIGAGAANSGNSLLSGQYSFLFKGFDSDGAVTLAGTLTANGNGGITAGTVDANRVTGVALGGSILAAGGATPPGSTYAIGSDGRGTMELNFAFGQNTPIVADYDLVMDSNGNVKFFEDYATATSTDTKHTHGEGVLKKVVGPASFGAANFSGNYAFVLPGPDPNGKPAALAGVIHADGNQTISPGTGDLNDAGTYSPQVSLSGDFAFGAGNEGAAALTFAPTGKPQVTLNFDFFFVTPSDLYFIETDSDAKMHLPANFFRLSGEVILQQTSAVFDQTAMQGVSVASGTGIGSGGNASVFAGLLTSTLCNDSNAVSLSYDENNGGAINGGGAPPILFNAGTCVIVSTGRVGFAGLGASAAQTRVAAAYLTGPGQGFLIGSDAAVTTGRLEQQTSGPAFALTSFLDGYTLTAPFVAEAGVKNVAGQTTADGAGNLAGTVDEIDPTGAAKANLAQALSGSFSDPSPNGRGTIAATGTVPDGFPTNSVFYVVSPGSVRVVSSDATDTHPQLILLDH